MQKNEDVGDLGPSMGEVLAKLKEHEDRLLRLEGLSASEPQKFAKAVSIREFMIQKQPKSDVEKTFTVGYFLERNKGLPSFNAKDLGDGFREAKETIPANVNLAALKNVQKGLFMEAGEKKDGLKAWTLTNSGMSHFDAK